MRPQLNGGTLARRGKVMATDVAPAGTNTLDQSNQVQLATLLSGPGYQKYGRFIFAILGSIPWVGSLMAAAAALHGEAEQGKTNELMYRWVEEHEQTLSELTATVHKMVDRLEQLGENVDVRLSEESYLGLVRYGFRVWDESSSKEKREHVRHTLTNAAGTKICSDDVVRLFLQWLQQYNELHFRVIRILYQNPGSTRAEIWAELHGEHVREDSADADLFKLMMRDLSTGSVLRQSRDTTADGQFLARSRSRRVTGRRVVLESAFEDSKPYELTELGSQFVHYAMNDIVGRIEAPKASSNEAG
jgi:hypothetical protein